ncbi:hypothetical protein HK101_009915 [Irineochytrium annulatum]|nr:hypothetical protein HK101_009915 [Irineochytrium annulatum]
MAHPLSLKVMRLSRPSFHLSTPSPYGSSILPASTDTWESAQVNDVTASRSSTADSARDRDDIPLNDSGLSGLLSLPTSFGNIYLGETFSSYLCINNESGAAVEEVSIKAELQTSSQRFTLADTLTVPRQLDAIAPGSDQQTTPSRVSLLPTQSAEFLIHHEIKELGIHILVCSVHYASSSSSSATPGSPIVPGGERKFFRKFYKFQVLNPLAVKTKVNTLQDGRVFLEAQVQNVTGFPMYLERLRFEASSLFEFIDMNRIVPPNFDLGKSSTARGKGGGGEGNGGIRDLLTSESFNALASVFGGSNYINPQDSRQYLYMLLPKTPHDPLAKTTPTLGKLDILWRTLLGQTGRLQTSQLSRKVLAVEPFEITVLSLPDAIYAEEPFVLKCRMRNNLAGESLRLSITGIKSKMSSVLLWGPSEIQLGELGPLGCKDFDLHFFPLLSGLLKVVGLRVSEANSGTSREVESVADVFVLSKQGGDTSKSSQDWAELGSDTTGALIESLQSKSASKDDVACAGTGESYPHAGLKDGMFRTYPKGTSGLHQLEIGWEAEGFENAKYEVWRRVMLETLQQQIDHPLLMPPELNFLLREDEEDQ